MKLDDVLDDEVAIRSLRGKGLHVIGTCGNKVPCKFYKNDGNYSNCVFDDVYEPVGPAYGCIHWQKKQ